MEHCESLGSPNAVVVYTKCPNISKICIGLIMESGPATNNAQWSFYGDVSIESVSTDDVSGESHSNGSNGSEIDERIT